MFRRFELSYDIRIIKEEYSSNYTSNVYEMLNSAFLTLRSKGLAPEYYTHWTEPLTVIDETKGRDYLQNLIQELKSDKDKYSKYNPKNNWGSYETVIQWLEDVLLHWKSGCEVMITW